MNGIIRKIIRKVYEYIIDGEYFTFEDPTVIDKTYLEALEKDQKRLEWMVVSGAKLFMVEIPIEEAGWYLSFGGIEYRGNDWRELIDKVMREQKDE